ncbi:MAG: 5-carboxymethyl-2-hydroxymuconate isomerase [Gammaproteobacteria bacterium]|jgi:5-carboxymethyl-2-hydroxymuconate isomerase
MPHIVLEYSSNVPRLAGFAELFAEVHQALHSIGGIKLDNCKSRARVADDYYIGDGDSGNAFIHLNIEFVAGRSTEVKQAIGNECLRLLKHYYQQKLSDKLQITVQIDDLLLDFYFKYPEGTLTKQ